MFSTKQNQCLISEVICVHILFLTFNTIWAFFFKQQNSSRYDITCQTAPVTELKVLEMWISLSLTIGPFSKKNRRLHTSKPSCHVNPDIITYTVVCCVTNIVYLPSILNPALPETESKIKLFREIQVSLLSNKISM